MTTPKDRAQALARLVVNDASPDGEKLASANALAKIVLRGEDVTMPSHEELVARVEVALIEKCRVYHNENVQLRNDIALLRRANAGAESRARMAERRCVELVEEVESLKVLLASAATVVTEKTEATAAEKPITPTTTVEQIEELSKRAHQVKFAREVGPFMSSSTHFKDFHFRVKLDSASFHANFHTDGGDRVPGAPGAQRPADRPRPISEEDVRHARPFFASDPTQFDMFKDVIEMMKKRGIKPGGK